MNDITVTAPTRPSATVDKYVKAVWNKDYEQCGEKKRKLEELKSMAYALVLRQCSPCIMMKLEGKYGYINVKKNRDLRGLLNLIEAICCNFDAKTKPYWVLMRAHFRLTLLWQDKNMSNDKYHEEFEIYMETIETIESYGGTVGCAKRHVQEELNKNTVGEDNPTENEIKDANMVAKNGTMAAMFLRSSHNELYRDLKTKLENDFTKGIDNYPMNLDDVVAHLNAY